MLTLATRGSLIDGVGISDSATEVIRARGETVELSSTYEFALHRVSSSRIHGWAYTVGISGLGRILQGPGPLHGEGFSRECHLPGAVPAAVYEGALAVLGAAGREALPPPQLSQAAVCG